jgi:hypothetical protein
LDDLWLAEKFQSNSEIAGSPRNSFRASVTNYLSGVELWLELGPARVPTLVKLRIPRVITVAVRKWGLSSIFKRVTAQIAI